MNNRIRCRSATRQDVTYFYPDIKHSFKAIVAEDDDGLLGIGGVYYDGLNVVAFSTFKPEIEKYPLAKARGTLKIMEIVKSKPCVAVASDKIEGSEKLLKRLGWEHVEGRIYKWNHSAPHSK